MSKTKWLSLVLASALLAGNAYAEDEQPADDVTMEVLDDEAAPEDIISLIQLPDDASDTARENAAKGLETANAARADGRAFGQSMAELRGEHGREIGESAREAAADIANEARQSASDAAAEARQNAADVAAEARENRDPGTGRP
jgi:hypothetical protein